MNLQPIAVLIDELKHEDVSLRINAIRRLSTIALALGFERTREELIPFLQSLNNLMIDSVDEEDEVLVVMAEELGRFVDYVGGPNYAYLLLNPLEQLAAMEETLVRDKAVASIIEISKVLSPKLCEDHLVPVINRLSSGDWFTRKISACGIIPHCYPKVSPTLQHDLRQVFTTLCQDESPMVRRAAATNFPLAEKSDCLTDLLPQLNNLANDEQDSVRLLSVEILVDLSEKLTHEEKIQVTLPHLRSLWSDKSWRVRYMVGEKIVHIAQTLGNEIVNDELNVAYSQLLKDPEAEVRNVSCTQLPKYCELIPIDATKKYILPCLSNLVTDSSQHVRASLASEISGLSPLLGKETTMEFLLPLFLLLLKDDFHEVRLNIISKLDKVSVVIGIELLSQSLLPAIIKLAEDKQWRVRLAIIEHIPLLAKQFGVDFFNEKLINLCFEWLSDPVFAIREAATINLKNLIVVFGNDWAVTQVIPKILEMSKSENYLYRLTVIFAITTVASSLGQEVLKSALLQIVKSLSADPIPNVRFNVAKSLQTLTKIFNEANQTSVVNEQIRPILLTLQQDKDQDVKYFANKALEATTAMVS